MISLYLDYVRASVYHDSTAQNTARTALEALAASIGVSLDTFLAECATGLQIASRNRIVVVCAERETV